MKTVDEASAVAGARAGGPAFEERGRIPSLDGLRGLAVLLVLLAHYVASAPWMRSEVGEWQSYLRVLVGLGGSGVDLFFVLSGFLIGGILIDNRDSPQLMQTFYLRRFLRIVPVAWGAIVVSMLVHAATAGGAAPSIPWWTGFTFTTNIFQAAENGWVVSLITAHWSLAIEEQFYLVFPWLVRTLPAAAIAWLGPGLIAIALLSRGVVVGFFPDHLFVCQMLPFCRADSLGVGVLVAWLVRAKGGGWLGGIRTRLWWALSAGGVVMLLVARLSYRAPVQHALWSFTLIALFYGCLLLLVYDAREGWVRGFFSSALMRLYGRYSYFIYVFQLLLAGRLVGLFLEGRFVETEIASPLHSLVAVGGMLLPAALSWHFFEAPLIKIGHRWGYR